MSDFRVRSHRGEYEVLFPEDLAGSLGDLLRPDDVLLVDAGVAGLHRGLLSGFLGRHRHLLVEASEEQKSYLRVGEVIQRLIEAGVRKDARLVAVGGGVTQDVTAFTASILYRGMDWIFLPTTLLAQCDSCIGSKTSVNVGPYKNQLGTFHPPRRILVHAPFLRTLPEAEVWSGLGEMLHYVVVAGDEDLGRFAAEFERATRDEALLLGLVRRSLEIKKAYVELDEFDRNERQVFNYGHSFGHAIESLTGYRVPHGIAVAYGMDMANFVSVRMGLQSEADRQRVRAVCRRIWRDTPLGALSAPDLLAALSKDKKNVGAELRLILSRGPGRVFKAARKPDQEFAGWLEDYLATQL